MGGNVRRKLVAAVAVFVVVFGSAPVYADRSSDVELRQPLYLEWDHMDFDVLIVPPAHGQVLNDYGPLGGNDAFELNPIANSYIKATEKAIADWQRAIRAFGSSRLNRLKMNVYVAGRDVFPTSILSQLEVLIVYEETMYPAFLGVTQGMPAFFMESNGLRVAVVDNPQCVIADSMSAVKSFTFADMYNVAGHEFGHCLGVNHVSPAREPVIADDIMRAVYDEAVGGRDAKPHCMSSLNVAGLELVFDHKAQPNVATMSASAYRTITC